MKADLDRARELCLAALERRMRTRKELAQLLARKRIPPEVAEPVLDRLQEVGLVNDEAYARAFVASRQRTKPRGGRALAAELYAKGVSSEVVARILEETEEAEDPLEAARRAVAPKLRTLAGRPPRGDPPQGGAVPAPPRLLLRRRPRGAPGVRGGGLRGRCDRPGLAPFRRAPRPGILSRFKSRSAKEFTRPCHGP